MRNLLVTSALSQAPSTGSHPYGLVLLINSYGFPETDCWLHEWQSKELPYGCSVLFSCLKSNGFKVVQRDLRNLLAPVLSGILTSNDFEEYLDRDNITALMSDYLSSAITVLPDLSSVLLVGFSVMSYCNYPYALALSKVLKKDWPHLKICIGGTYITINNLAVPCFIDYAIKGNGCGPICHLADHVVNNTALCHTLPGLYSLIDGMPICNGVNNEPAENEYIPDYSDLNLTLYEKASPIDGKIQVLVPYRTNIGCANQCSFCTGKNVDHLSFKSVEKVVREIRSLTKIHPNPFLRFCDASINSSPKQISELLNRIIEENIIFQWHAYVKISNLSKSLLDLFVRSGCKWLSWGVESISPRMINIYNKRFNPVVAEELIRYSAAIGIKNLLFFIYNGPGELPEYSKANDKFARSFLANPNITFMFFHFTVDEGSEIHRNPKAYNISLGKKHSSLKYSNCINHFQWEENGVNPSLLKQRHENCQRRVMRFLAAAETAKFLHGIGISLPSLLISLLSPFFHHGKTLSINLRNLLLRFNFMEANQSKSRSNSS